MLPAHFVELRHAIRIIITQVLKGHAIGKTMLGTQNFREAIAQRMHDAHFAIRQTEATHQRGHHQLVIILRGLSRLVAQVNLPAEG